MSQNFPIPGDTFEGRYRIQSILGAGGFARVYLAEQLNLDRRVAIKVLKPTGEKAETWIARFEREAKVISKFKNANTVMMYDYGRTDDDLTYMVLEYVEGKELQEVLTERGKFTASQTVAVLRQILESLREAHALGVIHRDIKPANIIIYDHLGATDQIKLLDFGIARVVDGDEKSNALTAEQSVVGTPSFMAPEQVTGGETRPASDLYSVGLVAYELLTGRRAADADSTIATMALHISDEPIFLPASVQVPGCLRAIVDTLLQKSLTDRYESAQQVLHDLQHWDAERVPRSSSSRPLLRYTPTMTRPAVVSTKEDDDVKSQVRLIGILLAGIVICSVLAALLVKVASDMDMMPGGEEPKPEVVDETIAEVEKPEAVPTEKPVEETAVVVPANIANTPEPKTEKPTVKKPKVKKKVSSVKPAEKIPAETTEEKPTTVEPPKAAEKPKVAEPVVEEKVAEKVVEKAEPVAKKVVKPVEKKTVEEKVVAEPVKKKKKKKKKVEIPLTF